MHRSILILLAACFEPKLQTGLPCSENGWCPPPQRCNMTTNVCDGGDAGVGGDGDVSPPEANIMFVTSEPIDFTMVTSLAIADAHCNTLAAQAGLGGTYIAWLSSATMNAKDRIPASTRGWVRPDRKPFAHTILDIVMGQTFYPPWLDERGRPVGDINVATGTLHNGFGADNCGGLSGNPMTYIMAGAPDGGSPKWTNKGLVQCNNALHLYCFGVGRDVEVRPPPPQGRWIFLSDYPATGQGGVAQLDSFCQLQGEAFDTSGTYVALVATSTSSAFARHAFVVDNARPWVRRDGVVVTNDMRSFQAPVMVTGTGQFYVNDFVLFGAQTLEEMPTVLPCNDWMDASMQLQAGLSSRSFGDAFSGAGLQFCEGPRVYCAQL